MFERTCSAVEKAMCCVSHCHDGELLFKIHNNSCLQIVSGTCRSPESRVGMPVVDATIPWFELGK
jgi:hypothetical protein